MLDAKSFERKMRAAPQRLCQSLKLDGNKREYHRLLKNYHPDKVEGGTVITQFIVACKNHQEVASFSNYHAPEKKDDDRYSHLKKQDNARRSARNNASTRSGSNQRKKEMDEIESRRKAREEQARRAEEEVRRRRKANREAEQKRQQDAREARTQEPEKEEDFATAVKRYRRYLKEEMKEFPVKPRSKPSKDVSKLGAMVLLFAGLDADTLFSAANALDDTTDQYNLVWWTHKFLKNLEVGTPEYAAEIAGTATPTQQQIETLLNRINGADMSVLDRARKVIHENRAALTRMRAANEAWANPSMDGMTVDDIMDALIYELRHMFRATIDARVCAYWVYKNDFESLPEAECASSQVQDAFKQIWEAFDGRPDLQSKFHERVIEAGTLFWMPPNKGPVVIPNAQYISDLVNVLNAS